MDFLSPIPTLTTVLLCVIFIRSISNFFKLKSNILWIEKNKNTISLRTKQKTPIIVCIPMLREQRIVKETMEFFSKMNVSRDNTTIIIVTTEKEIRDKEISRKQIPKLCKAIRKKQSLNKINEQFLGLFNLEGLKEVYKLVSDLPDLKSANQAVNMLYDKMPTTNDLANQAAKKLSRNKTAPKFLVIHYPKTEGVMADQINFCAQWVQDNLPCFRDCVFAVYNADSRPDPNTLIAVDQTTRNYRKKHNKDINLIQQSSLFLSNFHTFSKTFTGTLLRVCALMQSKWTLTHEINRLRRQSTYAGKSKHGWLDILLSSKLSHCVGHGLFVRLPFLLSHPLPTKLMNEDLPFGYFRSCEREPIAPLALLENAQSPETLKSVINQKKVWFWPYLEYSKCWKRTLFEKKYKSLFEVHWLTVQGLIVGVVWFFQSVVFTLPLVVAIIYLNLELAIFWLIAILIYWVVPVSYIEKHILKKGGYVKSELKARDYWGIVPFLSLYSLGPWQASAAMIKKTLMGTNISKIKTER
jgi:hypothetical protein